MLKEKLNLNHVQKVWMVINLSWEWNVKKPLRIWESSLKIKGTELLNAYFQLYYQKPLLYNCKIVGFMNSDFMIIQQTARKKTLIFLHPM